MGTKNNPGPVNCYENAHPDEPIFVLLGRDPAAPLTIKTWVEIRRALGREDATDALSVANDMGEWARSLGKKVAEGELPEGGILQLYSASALHLAEALVALAPGSYRALPKEVKDSLRAYEDVRTSFPAWLKQYAERIESIRSEPFAGEVATLAVRFEGPK